MIDHPSSSADPPHVVLASRDRRFLKVAGFLLAREGALVSTVRTIDDLPEVVRDADADLLILDMGDSLGEVHGVIGRLAETQPGLVVVVVSDGDTAFPRKLELTLWPKWHALEGLFSLAGPRGSLPVERGRQLVS
jgi:hypothetical protein